MLKPGRPGRIRPPRRWARANAEALDRRSRLASLRPVLGLPRPLRQETGMRKWSASYRRQRSRPRRIGVTAGCKPGFTAAMSTRRVRATEVILPLPLLCSTTRCGSKEGVKTVSALPTGDGTSCPTRQQAAGLHHRAPRPFRLISPNKSRRRYEYPCALLGAFLVLARRRRACPNPRRDLPRFHTAAPARPMTCSPTRTGTRR